MRRMRKTFVVPSLCRSVYTQLLDTIVTRKSKLLLLPFISSKCPESPPNMDEVMVYIYDTGDSGKSDEFGDSGDSGDSSDSGESGDSGDFGEYGDSGECSDSGECGDSG